MPVPIRSVKFWLNAFIPRDVPGYTLRVPAGPHMGKTMIPGPMATTLTLPNVGAFLRYPMAIRGGVPSIQTTVGWSDCYLTDQRSFSSDPAAKSRMHTEVHVDFTASIPRMTQHHNCDITTECDCEDGTVECSQRGSTHRMRCTLQAGSTRTLATVKLQCAANNPCAPTSRLGGDIDYKGTLTINIADSERSIVFDGYIDQFPAFEAYATINEGQGVTMFQCSPPAGNTVMNLPGGANRKIKAKLEDLDADGIFRLARGS